MRWELTMRSSSSEELCEKSYPHANLHDGLGRTMHLPSQSVIVTWVTLPNVFASHWYLVSESKETPTIENGYVSIVRFDINVLNSISARWQCSEHDVPTNFLILRLRLVRIICCTRVATRDGCMDSYQDQQKNWMKFSIALTRGHGCSGHPVKTQRNQKFKRATEFHQTI